MKTINIIVANKKAIGDETIIVCNNSSYQVKFTFDEEWQDYVTKTMRIKYNGNYNEVVFVGDTVNLPQVQNTLYCEIGVYSGNLETTTPARFDCQKSILCGAEVHKEPTPDVYNQIVELVESGALKGEQGERGEKGERGSDGSDYVITENDYNNIADIVVEKPQVAEAIENAETALNIAKDKQYAISYGDYQTFITAFNSLPNDAYKTGQSIYIVTRAVPDLWISEVMETSTPFVYVNDANIVNALDNDGFFQVGFYKISALESGKVDLTDYVKNNDYVFVKNAVEGMTTEQKGSTRQSLGAIDSSYVDEKTEDFVTIDEVEEKIYLNGTTPEKLTFTFVTDHFEVAAKDTSISGEVIIPEKYKHTDGNWYSVTSIGNSSFYTCENLTNIIIPNSVTNIDSSSFDFCSSLQSIVIPNSLSSINTAVFNNCRSLTSIVIPDSVTSIKDGAFGSCYSLRDITIKAITPPLLTEYSFYNTSNLSHIYVPAESVQTYKTAENWSEYADKIFAIPTVENNALEINNIKEQLEILLNR